ncbi:MAG: hypothetical protein GY832_44170, partial [Chloroflexi bacterium]|nr:hypothetical protein [Chloroflexota bacterium]
MENKLTFDITTDELEIFLEDANECLQAMESGILHLERKSDPETINSIFRAAHTLKALAGTVGHYQMADLTHAIETIFSEMREASLSPTQAVVDVLLEAVDILKAMRDEIVNRQPSGVDIAALLTRLRALAALAEGGDDQAQAPAASPPAPSRLTPEQQAQVEEKGEAGQTNLEIEIVAAAEAFAPAARLYQAAIALMEIGQIVTQQPDLDHLSEKDDRLWLVLATQSEPGDVEDFLSDINDLAEFNVQLYQPDSQTPTPASSGNGSSP